ncbi:MAG: hypothetical protein QXQ69_03655 [Candidatus Aenigmatarchaeota archaeon]
MMSICVSKSEKRFSLKEWYNLKNKLEALEKLGLDPKIPYFITQKGKEYMEKIASISSYNPSYFGKMKARKVRKVQLELLILRILSLQPKDLLTLGMEINQEGRRIEYRYVVKPMIQKGLIAPFEDYSKSLY